MTDAQALKNASSGDSLPSPDDRPDADVVIYDGDCSFCQGQVSRIARLDCRGRLAFLSLHDPGVARAYPDLSHDQLMQDMYVVDRRGRPHGGAAAFRYLSRRLPRLWWLVPVMHIPFSLPLWQWGYRRVANRRYKVSGTAACEDDSCAVHFRK